jgi:hypothetical protein
MKTVQFLSACAALALTAATLPAHATISIYSVVLNGASESPVNGSPGTGTGTVTIDDVLNTLSLAVTFSGLTGNTTASHIHCCTAVAGAGTAGVASTTPSFPAFPLGVTSGSASFTLDETLASSWNGAYITANGGTTASAFTALQSGINAGKAYLNIHTSTFGGGEIRGFLVPVPEASTYAMMLGGLAAVAGLVRRRRAA